MKKTVSININGAIFHIEEDAFELLKNYLDSISVYFSNFEDSKEIVQDIENRISEILYSQLSDGKQVITKEMIVKLIQKMGKVEDFKVLMDEMDNNLGNNNDSENNHQDSQDENYNKLYRFKNQKILGGVCAGIAHFCKVDPIWIRLVFLVAFFNFITFISSGIIFLAYIVLWIALPLKDDKMEDKKNVKFFRNSKHKVIAGVCSGLASFFKINVTIVRIVFLISLLFFGIGFFTYIAIWILSPEAKTVTEKMQMEGQPITLSNIEDNIKKKLNIKEDNEKEQILSKVVSLPFRIIELLLLMVVPILKAMVNIARVFFGVIFIFSSFIGAIAVLTIFLFILGFVSPDLFQEINYSGNFIYSNFITEELNWFTAIAFLFGGFIPIVFLFLVGISLIAKKWILNSYFSFILLFLFLAGSSYLGFIILNKIYKNKDTATVRKEYFYPLTNSIPVIKSTGVEYLNNFDNLKLQIKSHKDTLYKVKIEYKSQGKNIEEAKKYASEIKYNFKQTPQGFEFEKGIIFDEKDFHFQEVEATLYVPEILKFKIDESIEDIISDYFFYDSYCNYDEINEVKWYFQDSKLQCNK